MPPSYDIIFDEYEDGTIAARDDKIYLVRTPDGREIQFGRYNESVDLHSRRQARLFAALYVQLDGVPMLENKDAVPISAAAAGKPAIASYIYAVHQDQYDRLEWYQIGRFELANKIDVQPDTILKYHRRTQKKAKPVRVGGESSV